ncbi:MAG: hypothetical protein WBD27_02020 [Pyrinomonadaceae bacterium]
MPLYLQVLRWIAVLPGSLLIAALSLFPVHWILYLVITRFVEVYPEMPERILGPAIVSAVFVWVGSRISPAYKFETSIVLFGIWMFLIGGGVFLTLGDGDWFGGRLYFQGGGVPTIMAVIGAAVGLFVARSEQLPPSP